MKIICLANSFKEGDRCLAGIELDDQNQIVSTCNGPKWIRPESDAPFGEIPLQFVKGLRLLDIIEFTAIKTVPAGHQTENVLADLNSIKVIDKFDRASLPNVCDTVHNRIFLNKGKAVSQEYINRLDHSLMAICVTDFEVHEVQYEDADFTKTRLKIKYRGFEYDLPVTDPYFLYNYRNDHDILADVKEVFLTLSLTRPWLNWYYKLVAAIIY